MADCHQAICEYSKYVWRGVQNGPQFCDLRVLFMQSYLCSVKLECPHRVVRLAIRGFAFAAAECAAALELRLPQPGESTGWGY